MIEEYLKGGKTGSLAQHGEYSRLVIDCAAEKFFVNARDLLHFLSQQLRQLDHGGRYLRRNYLLHIRHLCFFLKRKATALSTQEDVFRIYQCIFFVLKARSDLTLEEVDQEDASSVVEILRIP